ncbi:MAG TPA: hypothetical protein ENI23_02395 [bacterium]|nr:hypothetical protein [bacterium]
MTGKKQSEKWRTAILKSISKPCPEEKKNKISLTLQGRHCSPNSEFKKGDSRISGKNNSNWKGGITPKNKKARNCSESKEWRWSVFKRDGYTCRGCYKKGSHLHAPHFSKTVFFFKSKFVVSIVTSGI